MLAKFATDKQNYWDEFLDTSYNTSVQESSHFSPFEVMFGRKATLPIDLTFEQQQPKEKVIENLELSASTLDIFTVH